MNVLLLEDEIPAYEKLLGHLENHFDTLPNINWSRSLVKARKMIQENDPYDIIISDIKLLDGISIDLFEELKISCPIIFCTAYNEYLLDAFKSNGIDYILKPYGQEDVTRALEKYNSFFNKSSYKIDYDVLKEITTILAMKKDFKSKFMIKSHKGIYLLSTINISHVQASGAFCKLIDDKGKAHLISQSISSIYESLNPNQFFRVNRSHIVNVDHILHIENYFKNRLSIDMKGAKQKINTSSSTTASFRTWLDSQ